MMSDRVGYRDDTVLKTQAKGQMLPGATKKAIVQLELS
jgi:hypothetical protein